MAFTKCVRKSPAKRPVEAVRSDAACVCSRETVPLARRRGTVARLIASAGKLIGRELCVELTHRIGPLASGPTPR